MFWGLAAWHRDDVAEAVRWLSSDAAMLVTPLFGNQYDQLILTARVAAAAGDAGLRARMLDCVTLLEREQPPVVMVAAITDYLCGILECDSERLLAAANSLQSLGWPLLSAGAVEQAGEEFVRTGQRAGAVEQLNAAFDSYRSHGALAERRISSGERPRTGWNSLTQSELRVVHLIAAGATNARVAEQLYLSPHTVKTHVRNAFTKLGISSRAELRRLMRR